MNNNKIGIFDSGVGGLTVLEEIRKLLPNEEYYYYADTFNNPYGEKTCDELYEITSLIVEYLIEKGVKIIVIACNTATTRCINYLRDKYRDIIFIGTEPAIKVACDNNYNNVLLLATPLTINSERTSFLVEHNKRKDMNIYLSACEGLAHAIEINDVKSEEKIIKDIYQKYKDKNIDAIVLGCTHYPLIKELIGKYFKDVILLDGGLGVAKEVQRKLIENNLQSKSIGKVTIYNSLTKDTTMIL